MINSNCRNRLSFSSLTAGTIPWYGKNKLYCTQVSHQAIIYSCKTIRNIRVNLTFLP